MAKVSIVVLQYNKSDYTLKCLESLKALDADVIVIDNGSEVQHLKNVEFWIASRKISNYKLLISNENLGYGGGNNLGIKYALEHAADYILILNNDTVVGHDFLDTIPDADISGPFVHKIKWLFPQGFPNGNISDKNSYINGAAMLVRREVFEKIGLLDEQYFLYFEDVDFCFRARKAGFALAKMPAKIHHEESSSVNDLGLEKKLLLNARNARIFFSKFAPWYVRLLLPLWYPMVILYLRLHAYHRHRM